MAQSYEKAGVNLEAGYEVVRRIKKHVASTSRLGVMGNIGVGIYQSCHVCRCACDALPA